jgi:hypothetical protein
MRLAAYGLTRNSTKALAMLRSHELPALGIAPNTVQPWGYAASFFLIPAAPAFRFAYQEVVRSIRRSRQQENLMRSKGSSLLSPVHCVRAVLAASVAALVSASAVAGGNEPAIIMFDAPGAVATVAYSISVTGAVTGVYYDSGGVQHGFVRTPEGRILTFDAPGAGTEAGQGTEPWSINAFGAITGEFWDAGGVIHGFRRAPDGQITTFDSPGAGTNSGQGTAGEAINSAGWVGGDRIDASNVLHPFLRDPGGVITEYTVPGASGEYPGYGSWVDGECGINVMATITGAYLEPGGAFHGYVRTVGGEIALIDVPEAGTGSFQGTLTSCINWEGSIAGNYVDAGGVNHGFVRTADGTITTFDFPGAATGPGQGTVGLGINSGGAIVGSYYDAMSAAHGFVRTPYGSFKAFNAPGAGAGAGQGTFPQTNNWDGAITGYWVDASNVPHGFVYVGEKP